MPTLSPSSSLTSDFANLLSKSGQVDLTGPLARDGASRDLRPPADPNLTSRVQAGEAPCDPHGEPYGPTSVDIALALARLSWGRPATVRASLTAPFLGIRAGQTQRCGGTTCAARRHPGRTADVSARHSIASTSEGLARSARTSPLPASKLTSSARSAPTLRRPLPTC